LVNQKKGRRSGLVVMFPGKGKKSGRCDEFGKASAELTEAMGFLGVCKE